MSEIRQMKRVAESAVTIKFYFLFFLLSFVLNFARRHIWYVFPSLPVRASARSNRLERVVAVSSVYLGISYP